MQGWSMQDWSMQDWASTRVAERLCQTPFVARQEYAAHIFSAPIA
jgi:hypothetical protein